MLAVSTLLMPALKSVLVSALDKYFWIIHGFECTIHPIIKYTDYF